MRFLASFLTGLFCSFAAHSQNIIVDPSSSGTTFLGSSTGADILDISTPVEGVSHNKFTEFNVDSSGLVVNNSATDGISTVLGVSVTGNSNLVSGPAHLILNEVTSSSSSSLSGTVEIFGSPARLVISNPNGVTCNGCSFPISDYVDLTTGSLDVDLNEVNYGVRKGIIRIGSSGIEAKHLGIYGRHVDIDGPVNVRVSPISSNFYKKYLRGEKGWLRSRGFFRAAPILTR